MTVPDEHGSAATDGAAARDPGEEPAPPAGRRWRLPLVYPAVLPAVYVYNAWVESSIHYAHLIGPLIVAILVSLALVALLTFLAGDRDLGALAAFAVSLAATTSNPAAGLVLLALALFILVLARTTSVSYGPTISRLFTTIGTIFLVVTVVTSLPAVAPVVAHDASADLGAVASPVVGPNIYVLMLDGFPGDRAARTYDPAWDRAHVPDGLRARGFQVVPDGRSNYLKTALTLASMFSMRHLTPADEGPPSHLRWMVDGGEALRVIRAHGYETTAISSGFAPVDIHSADHWIAPPQLAELEISLLRSTNLRPLLTTLAPDLPSAQQRGRIESTFAALEAEAARGGGSRFVFAHVPAPHGPFVFRADGSPRTEGLGAFYGETPNLRGVDRAETIDRYLEQSTYVGERALRAVDRIIAADPNAVIAVFSDHGPGVDLSVSDPMRAGVNERMSNLLALRSPDGAVSLPDDTTPINLFPILFNAYFGESIDLLPDDTFAWADGDAAPTRIEP